MCCQKSGDAGGAETTRRRAAVPLPSEPAPRLPGDPISRTAVRYTPLRPLRDLALAVSLKALGERYPRYGYLLLHEMLKAEGRV